VIHDLLECGGIVEPFFNLQNINLERRDPTGRTLLLAACDHADIIIIGLILERGASSTARDNQGRNALHHILKSRAYGGHDSLRLLIGASGDELINQVDAAGYTPLHYALHRIGFCVGVDTRAVKLLLAHGADPLIPDPLGNTALHLLGKYLAENSRNPNNPAEPRELFKHFLSLGLPINGRNHKDETALLCFIAFIESTKFNYPPTSKEENQSNALQLFIDAGADLSVVTHGNNTLLHIVAAISLDEEVEEDHKLMVSRFKWLMEQGLDPMTENDENQTCLDVANIKGNQCILDLFQD
jgi:ankyrin repeat protein